MIVAVMYLVVNVFQCFYARHFDYSYNVIESITNFKDPDVNLHMYNINIIFHVDDDNVINIMSWFLISSFV